MLLQHGAELQGIGACTSRLVLERVEPVGTQSDCGGRVFVRASTSAIDTHCAERRVGAGEQVRRRRERSGVWR